MVYFSVRWSTRCCTTRSRAGCTVCITKNYPVTVNDPALTEHFLKRYTAKYSEEKGSFPGAKQVFYGVCLLVVVMVLPDGVWPWLARKLGLTERPS